MDISIQIITIETPIFYLLQDGYIYIYIYEKSMDKYATNMEIQRRNKAGLDG